MRKEKLTAFGFFALLTLIFFHQIFLGLIPIPSDLIVGGYYPWLNYKWGYEVGVPVKNSLLTDAVSITYPLRTLAADFIKNGEFPLWNPYLFGGYPLLGSLTLGLLFPTTFFYLFLPNELAWTIQILIPPFLGSFFTYLFVRSSGLKFYPAIFSGIAYGFGGFMMVWLEWNNQAATIASLFPALVYFQKKLQESDNFKYGVIFSLVLCLMLFASYLPLVQFSLTGVLLLFLFFNRSLKNFIKLLIFGILGVFLSAIILLPNIELIINSQRPFETVNFSDRFVPIYYLITLLVPDFFGNPATGNFWGDNNYLNVSLYTGITTLILATITLFKGLKQRLVIFSLTLIIVSLVISINTPLANFIYELGIWGGKSVTLNRTFFLINFGLAILAGVGLDFLTKSNLKTKLLLQILFSILGFSLLAVVYLILTANFNLLANLAVILRNLILPIVFLAATILVFVGYKLKLITQKYLQLSLIFLVTIELFRFGLKYNTFSKKEFLYPETPVIAFLKNQPNQRFVAEQEILSANMWLPYHLESYSGYDASYPLVSAKLISTLNLNDPNVPPQSRAGVISNFNSPLIDRINIKYLLALKKGDNDKVTASGIVDRNIDLKKYKEVFSEGPVTVLENKEVLPRAYLVPKVVKVSNDGILEKLIDPKFDAKNSALSSDFELEGEFDPNAKVEFQRLSNNKVSIKTKSNKDSFLVLLETFYPGWEVKIDGNKTKIHKTNFAFRGVFVPKGKHLVEFTYNPKSIQYGLYLTLTSALVLILTLAYPIIKSYSLIYRRKNGIL